VRHLPVPERFEEVVPGGVVAGEGLLVHVVHAVHVALEVDELVRDLRSRWDFRKPRGPLEGLRMKERTEARQDGRKERREEQKLKVGPA